MATYWGECSVNKKCGVVSILQDAREVPLSALSISADSPSAPFPTSHDKKANNLRAAAVIKRAREMIHNSKQTAIS